MKNNTISKCILCEDTFFPVLEKRFDLRKTMVCPDCAEVLPLKERELQSRKSFSIDRIMFLAALILCMICIGVGSNEYKRGIADERALVAPILKAKDDRIKRLEADSAYVRDLIFR